MDEQHEYAAPQVEDLGTLAELTQAQAFTGPEDGGSKMLLHHETPSPPAGP